MRQCAFIEIAIATISRQQKGGITYQEALIIDSPNGDETLEVRSAVGSEAVAAERNGSDIAACDEATRISIWLRA